MADDGFTFKLSGGKELADALSQFTPRLEKNILRAAVRSGSGVIAAEAKALAPVLKHPDARRKAGTVRNAIRVRSTRSIAGQVVGGVAVRMLSAARIARFKRKHGGSGADNPNDPFYAYFLEYGTSKMAAQPFLRPALDAKAAAAIEQVGVVIAERITEALKP